MSQIERQKTKIKCQNPDCGRDIDVAYKDLWGGSRRVRCRKCRSEHRFDSSLASRAKRAASDLERSQDKFEEALQDLTRQKVEISVG